MNAAQEYVKDHAQFPRVELKDLKDHILELQNCKADTIEDKNTKKDIEGVKFLVKENGELKTIFTTSVVLIQKLADLVDSKSTVRVTQVKYFGNNNKELTSYNVSVSNNGEWVDVGEPVNTERSVQVEDNSIPIIEDGEQYEKDFPF
jgi:hypothetical protein